MDLEIIIAKGNKKLMAEKLSLAKKEMIFGGYTKKILDVDVFPMILEKEIKASGFSSIL